jgi:hypothetical protein
MGIALSIETGHPMYTGLTDTGLTDTGLTDTESIDSDDDFDPVIYGGDPIT